MTPPRRRGLRTTIAWLLAAAAIAGGAASLLPWAGHVEHSIAPADITPVSGYAYHAPLQLSPPPLFTVRSDSNDSSTASQLTVEENGVAVGPPHTLHATIGTSGGGGFSHWGDGLYFSSSDNSDPRVNGRAYVVSSVLAPSTTLTAGSLLAGVLALALLASLHRARLERLLAALRRANGSPLVLWLTAAALMAYFGYVFAIRFAAFPQPSPDSNTYLHWELPFRTPGYPGFLSLYDLVLPDRWRYFPVIQVTCLVAGMAVLAAGVGAHIRSYFVAAALLVAMASLDGVMVYGQLVLTEAVFCATVYASVGLALLTLARRTPGLAWGAGAFMAYAAAVKPVAIAMPLGILAVALPFERRRLRVATAILVPSLLYHAAFAGYSTYAYGTASSSLAGYSLFGHVAWAVRADQPSRYPELTSHLAEALAPVVSKRPVLANLREYYIHTTNEYNTLLWATAVPAAVQWLKARGQPADREHLGTILLTMAGETMRAHPRSYAHHVWAHYFACWDGIIWPGHLFTELSASAAPTLEAYLAQPDVWRRRIGRDSGALEELTRQPPGPVTGDLPFDTVLAVVADHTTTTESVLLHVRRPLWIGSLLVLLLFPLGAWRDPRLESRATQLLGACFVASAVINVYFLTHASAQVYLTRYAGVMAPLAAALAMLLTALILELLLTAARGWRRPAPIAA